MANINNTDIEKKTLNFGELFQLDPTLIAHCFIIRIIIIIIIIIFIIVTSLLLFW